MSAFPSCEKCFSVFASVSLLKKHMEDSHPTPKQICTNFHTIKGCQNGNCKFLHQQYPDGMIPKAEGAHHLTPTIICKHFNTLEGCKHGAKCKFLHQQYPDGMVPKADEIHSKKSGKICKFYSSSDGCKYGDKCKNQHINAAESAFLMKNTHVTNHGKNTKISSTDITEKTSVIVTTITQTVTKTRTPYQVLFLLDDSGSMAGAFYKRAIDGIKTVLTELNEDDDWAGVACFSEKKDQDTTALRQYKDFVPLKTKREEIDQHLADLEKAGACGAKTALYDAIVEAVGNFKVYSKLPDLQHLLIVATDGENNVGTLAPEDVNKQLHEQRIKKKLNLHVTILPIALQESQQVNFKKILAGAPPLPGNIQRPKLGEVHSCEDSKVVKEKFKEAFKNIVETVKTTNLYCK